MKTSMVQNNGVNNSHPSFKAITATKSFANANFAKPEFLDTVKATKRIVGALNSSEISGLEHMYQKGSEILESLKKLVDPESVNIHIDQTGSSTFITGHTPKKHWYSKAGKIESSMLEPKNGISELIHVTPETLATKIQKISGFDTNA